MSTTTKALVVTGVLGTVAGVGYAVTRYLRNGPSADADDTSADADDTSADPDDASADTDDASADTGDASADTDDASAAPETEQLPGPIVPLPELDSADARKRINRRPNRNRRLAGKTRNTHR